MTSQTDTEPIGREVTVGSAQLPLLSVPAGGRRSNPPESSLPRLLLLLLSNRLCRRQSAAQALRRPPLLLLLLLLSTIYRLRLLRCLRSLPTTMACDGLLYRRL